MGRAMFSKSSIQFSVYGWSCVPSLLFTWGQTIVEVVKIMATFFHSFTGNSWTFTGKSGSVSCGVTAPFSWVLVCTRFCLCPSRVYFLVLFWQLYGGVNGDLLQDGFCHTQVCCTQPYPSCCTQNPCPCSSPLLTCASTGDGETQLPCGPEGKASACNAGDPGSIPGLVRSPGEGNRNPLQYSCLENPMDGEACTVHGVTKSRTQLSDFTFTLFSVYQIL